jgi:hypothetical protein
VQGFEGNTTPDQLFSHNLRSLIETETQKLREDENDALLEAFSPQAFHDSVAHQVGHSLGLKDDYLQTDEGQKIVYDIADFLEKERGVDRLEGVSQALMTLLNSMIVPKESQHPEGMARRIYQYLLAKRGRGKMQEEMANRERVWLPKSE